GMFHEKSIDTTLHLFQILRVRRCLITSGRTGCIVPVTGTGRPSPEINILREILSHVSTPDHFPVKHCHLGVSTVRSCHLGKQPKDKYVENTKKDTKYKGQSE